MEEKKQNILKQLSSKYTYQKHFCAIYLLIEYCITDLGSRLALIVSAVYKKTNSIVKSSTVSLCACFRYELKLHASERDH